MLSGKVLIWTERFIRPASRLWRTVLANLRILHVARGLNTCYLSIIFPTVCSSVSEKLKDISGYIFSLILHIQGWFISSKDTPLPILFATFIKKMTLKISLTSFCLAINLLFSVKITLLGPLVFFLERHFQKKKFWFCSTNIFFLKVYADNFL